MSEPSLFGAPAPADAPARKKRAPPTPTTPTVAESVGLVEPPVLTPEPKRPPREAVITAAWRDHLAPHPPLRQAMMILAEMPLGFTPFEPRDAKLAAMCWRLFHIARAAGILAGKPAFEAREMFAHRVRSAVQTSSSFPAWALGLAQRVGLSWDKVPTYDAVVWREFCDGLTPSDWRHFARHPTCIEDVIMGAAVLGDLMYEMANPPTTTEATP